MSDSSNVVEILTPADRDRRVLQLKIAGASVRAIGRQFRMTDKAVLAAVDRGLPTLDSVARARIFKTDLATLDQLQSYWFAQSKNSPIAANIVLRILERRAQLLGLDSPIRLDPIQIVSNGQPPEGSTEALLAALNAIARERPARQIEAEVEASGPPAA
jgi:hypothetical protein